MHWDHRLLPTRSQLTNGFPPPHASVEGVQLSLSHCFQPRQSLAQSVCGSDIRDLGRGFASPGTRYIPVRSLCPSVVDFAQLVRADLAAQSVAHAAAGGVRLHVRAEGCVLAAAEKLGDPVRALASGDQVVVLLQPRGGHARVVCLRGAPLRSIESNLDRPLGHQLGAQGGQSRLERNPNPTLPPLSVMAKIRRQRAEAKPRAGSIVN